MITIDSIVEEKDLVDAPKVSAKVREYVWEYIYENILTPKNIKLNNTFDYRFTLNLNKFNPELHKFFTDNPFNTENNKFSPELRFNKLGNLKFALLRVVSKNINCNTSPTIYANIVYDALGSFLTINYKKITKADFDRLKSGMDYLNINKFPFPASLNECNLRIV